MAYERKPIEVVDILLDPQNFRIGKKANQVETREAIVAEQGKKLLTLALDVIKLGGFSPFDLPFVYPSGKRADEYIMLEGNRRLLVLKSLLDPDLMRGTDLHEPFTKLHTKHGKSLESELFCAIAPNRTTGLVWVARKHQRGLGGSGTEDWNPIASDRFDAELGIPTPGLDAMDFVRTHAALSREVADKIDNSDFNISTLARLIGDDRFKQKLGLSLEGGKLFAAVDQDWLTKVLAETVTAIATGKFDGRSFKVSSVYEADQREAFADKLLEKYPKPARAVKTWTVGRDAAKQHANEKNTAKKAITKNTGDRQTLIPREYRLRLPDGKVNDIFHDLRSINVESHPNAVAVEMRVFLELSVSRFMDEFQLQLPPGTYDSLINRIKEILKEIRKAKLMKDDDLKAINSEMGNKHSFVAPDTLNAYVHNATFAADPGQLKITWNRLAPFVAALWLAATP
jgi:hypothetical protein